MRSKLIVGEVIVFGREGDLDWIDERWKVVCEGLCLCGFVFVSFLFLSGAVLYFGKDIRDIFKNVEKCRCGNVATGSATSAIDI